MNPFQRGADLHRFQAALQRHGTYFIQSTNCAACASDQDDMDEDDHEHEFQLSILPVDPPAAAPRLIVEFGFDAGGNFTGDVVFLDPDNPHNEVEDFYKALVTGQEEIDESADCASQH